jgi:hypothetical protein
MAYQPSERLHAAPMVCFHPEVRHALALHRHTGSCGLAVLPTPRTQRMFNLEDRPMNSDVSCSNCNGSVDASAPSCPHCGAVFDTLMCKAHPEEEADGACVICAVLCCSECGKWCDDLFLCGEHEGYEIMEERARVYGSTDVLVTEYATRCLEQAGLHPFVFSRKAYRNMDIAPNFSYRQFGNHNAAELKILVPFSEVQAAETLLRDLAVPPH